MGKSKNGKFSSAPASKALEQGQFLVPSDKQQPLRDLDIQGADLQKLLGGIEVDYLSRKNEVLKRFQENRQAYEKMLKDIAKTEGVDLEKTKDRWNFDFKTMVCTREGAVVPPVALAPEPTPVEK